ncbi:MAG: site-specific integrase [Bradyrhizobium sp.]|nr:site-specific integrase [Bradyrhizobium sp.]
MAKVRKRTWTAANGETRTAWAVDFTDSNGARQRKQFRSKRAADDFRVEIEGKLRAGTFRPDADRVTVKEVAEAYVDYAEGRSRRNERFTQHHLRVVKGRIWNYICPDEKRRAEVAKRNAKLTPFSKGIGAIKMSHLTARVVGDFRDRLREAGVSVVLTRKVLTTLHAMLDYAVGQDIVAVNAAHGVKVIGRRDEGTKKIVPPSKEFLKALIDAADPDFRLKIVVAASTGLRAGEMHALRWKHIDFDSGTLTVDTRVDRYGVEDVPKSKSGIRAIPVSATVLKHLREWKARSKFSKGSDLVFPNSKGTYEWHSNLLQGKFLPLLEKMRERHSEDPQSHPAVPDHMNWHGFRHFAISTWIESGLTPKTVQTFAGHSSLAMTMDLYGHLFKSEDHGRAMDSIAKGLFT